MSEISFRKKKCRRCQTYLGLPSFGKNKATYDGLQTDCRACRKIVQQEFTKKHGYQKMKTYRAGNKFLLEAKNKPCADCKVSYPPYVMDFDHLPQFEKSFNIAANVYRPVSELQAEIAKC